MKRPVPVSAWMKGAACAALCAFCACALEAAPGHRVAGSSSGARSIYATDAYPGFDGLDDLPKAEKKEKSWFLGVSRSTSAEQLRYARELEAEGSLRAARRACDALVREWPFSPEAPEAQLLLAMIWAQKEQDYEEAFAELNYALDFYAREVNYTRLVAFQYKLADLMRENRKTFWGMSFTSLRVLRQYYEMVVRRAPGAAYVPAAMLKIAQLREEDDQYEAAIDVYGTLMHRFPLSPEAREAVYRGSKARMWMVRRHAYNQKRCQDTADHLKQMLRLAPDHAQADEMKTWLDETLEYLAEDAYVRAKFYDTKQRSRHAAISAYERFLVDYPQTKHAREVRERLAELKPRSQETDAQKKEKQ